MTKKQYVGKVRQLQHNINKMAKRGGIKINRQADRVAVPNWGDSIGYSYAEVWATICENLKGSYLLDGIEI